VLTERGTHRRSRVSLAGWELQLYLTSDFLHLRFRR